jgi:hypothetical protein
MIGRKISLFPVRACIWFHHAVESATTSQAFPSRWFADAGSTLISTLLRPKKSAVPIFGRMPASHERAWWRPEVTANLSAGQIVSREMEIVRIKGALQGVGN